MGRLVRVFSPKRWLGCTAPRAQQLDFSACVDFMESQKIMPVAVVGDEPEEGAGGDPAVDIKCIAFRLKTCPSVPAVIVVIDQRRRVDLKKVAGCLERELGSEVSIRRQDVAMVDRDRLVETVGFPVGEVPPFGFPRDDMVRIVDEQLVEDGMLVRFGPGDGDVVIRGRDLLVGGGIAADVCERIDERRSGEDDGLHSIGTGLENTEPYEFETVMRVVRKRKLAKRLLFATVVPALHGGRHHAYSRHVRSPGGSLVWRHPETEKACELQLIVGKTVERRYGPKVMEQKILKRILKGGYVRVVGKVQANPKNDACVDVVVHDLETFGTSLIGVEDGTQGGRLGVTSACSMPEPLEKRPTQQPYVNLNTLKMKKKKKQGITEEDLLPEYAPARESSITMVTTMDDLRRLEDAVRRATAISLDAEWRPSTRQGSSNPVSLLQIGVAGSDKTTMGVFLIDMLELCFYCHDGSFDRELSDEQVVLSDILEALFGSETPKLGFGLRYDVKRLRESYPWLPCFRGNAPIISHVDVGMLGRLAGKVKAHKNLSLSKLTSAVLNMRLSKEEQMSDWGHRPLDERQIAYASNDVACLIDIFDALSSAEPGILSGRRSMDYVSLGLTELGTSNRGHAMGSGDGWYSGPEDNNDRLMNDPAAWELERRPRQPQKLPLKSCTCDPSLARDSLGEYGTFHTTQRYYTTI